MSSPPSTLNHGPLIGLVPAAGTGSRLGPLPCSKEVYPLVPPSTSDTEPKRARVACQDLLEAFAQAGVTETYVVVGHGKWDIPAYLGDGTELGLELAYLTIHDSPSTVHTVERARAFTSARRVAFGFPDILFRPPDAFRHLTERQATTGADLVLGLFPVVSPEKVDVVALDDRGRVVRVVIKPEHTDLELTWLLALWTDRFTQYLHRFLSSADGGAVPGAQSQELYLGDVVQAVIRDGWRVEGVALADAMYCDIGTPSDLAAAVGGLA